MRKVKNILNIINEKNILSGISKRIQRRRKGLIKLIIIFAVGILILFITYDNSNDDISIKQITFEVTTMVVSALLSTIIAIYMTKDDIMENDYIEIKDDFGIITFKSGYEEIFRNGDCKVYLNSSDWQQFFQTAKDHKICIVGVHINGFFENEKYRKCLLNLCLENDYIVDIILANPYSDEVIQQAYAEKKTSDDYIKNKILETYNLFQQDIKILDEQYSCFSHSVNDYNKPSERLRDKFKILFSNTLPKALIFRVGEYMIVSPYLFASPSQAPTLIVENSRAISFYDNYENYIKRLKETSKEYCMLNKHLPVSKFFDQPYRNPSSEFYEDMYVCESLDILGLGQKHMFTHLEQQIIKIIERNGSVSIILGDPDGTSTEMCVKRSLIHNNLDDAVTEHKITINTILQIKEKYNADKLKVYIWDCFFPYTLYIFNKGNKEKIKIYVWLTNLFEVAEKRLGFVIEGKNEPEQVENYLKQYNGVWQNAKEVKEKFETKK